MAAGKAGIELHAAPLLISRPTWRHVTTIKQIIIIIINFALSAATSSAMASSAVLFSSVRACEFSKPQTLIPRSNSPLIVSIPLHRRRHKNGRVFASISVSSPEVRTGPDDLVASILSKVRLGLGLRLGFTDSVAPV